MSGEEEEVEVVESEIIANPNEEVETAKREAAEKEAAERAKVVYFGIKKGQEYPNFDYSYEDMESYVESTVGEWRDLLAQCDPDHMPGADEDGKPILIELPKPDEEYVAAVREYNDLLQYLDDTDFVVIKIAEGAATMEKYASIIELRQEARKKINELEAKYPKLVRSEINITSII